MTSASRGRNPEQSQRAFLITCAVGFVVALAVGVAVLTYARSSSTSGMLYTVSFNSGAHAWVRLSVYLLALALLANQGASRWLVRGGFAAALVSAIFHAAASIEEARTVPAGQRSSLMLELNDVAQVAEVATLVIASCAAALLLARSSWRKWLALAIFVGAGSYASLQIGFDTLRPWSGRTLAPVFGGLGVAKLTLALGLGVVASHCAREELLGSLLAGRANRAKRGAILRLSCPRCAERFRASSNQIASCPVCGLDVALATGLTRCATCDYSLAGFAGDVCPECGEATGEAQLRAAMRAIKGDQGRPGDARSDAH